MATGGKYLFRRLEQLLPGVVATRYEKLKFYDGQVYTVNADLEAGAAELVRESLTEVGDSAIVSDGSFDIPVVDIASEELRYKIIMLASGFSWTMQQMRAMEKAGNANFVNSRKQRLAMRSIAERVNGIAAFGQTSLGFAGFMNNGDVTADNLSTDLYALTPDALAEFFIDNAATVAVSTAGTFDSSSILVSHDIYVLLAKTRMTDGSASVLSYLSNPQITGGMIDQILWTTQNGSTTLAANGAGVADKDRIVFYPSERTNGEQDETLNDNQPEMIERHVEAPQIAPQDYWEVRGLRQVVPMFMCTSPTIINYPESMLYVDVPEKAA